MDRKVKFLSLFLAAVIVVSNTLLFAAPAYAQTIPKPAVPEFTLQFVGQPYNALVIIVKNQPYNSEYGTLYYNVRLKDHAAGNDSWLYPLDIVFRMFQTYPTQSVDSDYTNITLTIQSNSLIVGVLNDIQVQAMLGNIGRHQEYSDSGQYLGAPYVFNGQTSDWSGTQIIKIPDNVPLKSNSPNPSSTETTQNTSELAVILASIAVVISLVSVISLLLYVRQLKKTTVKN